MFVNAAYFKEIQNRSLCVSKVHYGYRLNATIGVLTGFFTPQFLVMDVPEQHSVLEPYLTDIESLIRLPG